MISSYFQNVHLVHNFNRYALKLCTKKLCTSRIWLAFQTPILYPKSTCLSSTYFQLYDERYKTFTTVTINKLREGTGLSPSECYDQLDAMLKECPETFEAILSMRLDSERKKERMIQIKGAVCVFSLFCTKCC